MQATQKLWHESRLKQLLDKHLVNEVPLAPQRRYASMVILRAFDSTAVLTTEGQILDVETVRSGKEHAASIARVLFQKRKQVASERRTGRAFNRIRGWGEECVFLEGMCGDCPDCLIYGFAATSGEGSQRSRILTDSGFSIRPYETIQRSITMNAISDTTRGGVAGSAFAEREHIRPQVFFPTIETAVDVTPAEFVYILRNVLATTRYGAESNRQGYVHNHLLAICFSQTELTSNLALTQGVYDQLVKLKGEDFVKNSLEHQEVMGAVLNEVTQEMERAYFPFHIVKGEELESLLSDVRQLWRSEEGTQEWLQELENDHRQYQNRREQSRKKRK